MSRMWIYVYNVIEGYVYTKSVHKRMYSVQAGIVVI